MGLSVIYNLFFQNQINGYYHQIFKQF